MKHRKAISTAVLLSAWILQCPGRINAQDPQTNAPPKPAAKAYPPIGAEDDQDAEQAPARLQPDNRPLTGLQDLTVGTPPEKHSYWIPGFSYTNLVSSNAVAEGGENGWNTTSYVTGNLSLLQNWSTAQLSINYSGGETFSSDAAVGSGQFQQFSAIQTFNWQRIQLTFLDQFAYLPSAQFGFGAGTSLALPGVGGALAPSPVGLENGLTPSQSIATEVGPRYSNSSGFQFSYAITPRSSITIGGVFSALRFTESGGIESDDATLNAGYNYQLSRANTLGLSYRFTAYEYIGSPQAIGDHSIQAMYAKRITGRLAFKLSGGPEITTTRMPEGFGTQTQYVGPTGSASLSYSLSAGNLSLGYNHGVNNGSGVLLGATSDQVTASATRRLTRVWSGNLSLGYARNTNLAGISGTQGPAFDTLYVGAGLQRPISRNASVTLNYTANIQTSNNTSCSGLNCGTNFTTHEITVGLNWHTRPFVLH